MERRIRCPTWTRSQSPTRRYRGVRPPPPDAVYTPIDVTSVATNLEMAKDARRQGDMPATTLVAVMLAVFTVSLGYGVVLPLLPSLTERSLGTGASAAQVARNTGLLSSVYGVALFLFASAWGRLSDRRCRRGVLLIGLFGFAGTMLFFSFFESLASVYAERFLSGMFASAVTPVASAVVTDLAPTAQRRARQLAFVSTAGIGGVLLGPTLGVFIIRVAGELFGDSRSGPVSTPLVITAVLAVVAGIAVALAVRETQDRDAHTPASVSVEEAPRVVPRLLFLAFIVAAAIGSFHVGLAVQGKQDPAPTSYQLAVMFTECSVIMLVAQALVFSPLVEPDTTRWLVAPAFAVLAAALFLVPPASNVALMLSIVGAVAISAGILSPILTYWISANAGPARGAELGKQTAVGSLGLAVGSALAGLLRGFSALPHASFAATGGLVVLGVVLSAGLPRRLGRKPARGEATAPRP